VTCGTWIGFDNRQSLGEKETGAKAALPMWIDFMKAAVAAKPNEEFAKPNAPKRKVDLPVDTGGVVPKPAIDAEPDDSDAPATPAPSPVAPETMPADTPAPVALTPTRKVPAEAAPLVVRPVPLKRKPPQT
jgi:penicillin-binding protein 1A